MEYLKIIYELRIEFSIMAACFMAPAILIYIGEAE